MFFDVLLNYSFILLISVMVSHWETEFIFTLCVILLVTRKQDDAAKEAQGEKADLDSNPNSIISIFSHGK